VTKLPADAELALRRLDDEDETGADMGWAGRQPYRRLLVELLASSRNLAGIKALAKAGLGPERLAPAKRKRGEHRHKADPLAFAMDDMRRLKGLLPADVAEVVAAERCRRAAPHDRLWGQRCSIDKYGDLEIDCAEELADLVLKIHNRRRAGTTGAQRRRRAK
jgi:hypothetical protein